MRTKAIRQRGFTLVEVLLVLVILVGLGALAATTIFGSRDQAQIDETTVRMQKVMDGIRRFELQFNRYPDEEIGGLQALVEKPDFGEDALNQKWRSPFVDRDMLKDAWGQDLEFEMVPDSSAGVDREVPQLTSAGPDKEMGTEDDLKLGGSDEEEF
jgi:general secretion pathway protein G